MISNVTSGFSNFSLRHQYDYSYDSSEFSDTEFNESIYINNLHSDSEDNSPGY